MATWKERRGWRKEFADLGVRQTAEHERLSHWYTTPGKLQEARRWLKEQERLPIILSATIAAVTSLTGTVVGALLTAFLAGGCR